MNITRRCASDCTAGIYQTQFALREISGSKSRRWVGEAMIVTCHFKTIWRQWPFGIRPFLLPHSHLYQVRITWRSSNRRLLWFVDSTLEGNFEVANGGKHIVP